MKSRLVMIISGKSLRRDRLDDLFWPPDALCFAGYTGEDPYADMPRIPRRVYVTLAEGMDFARTLKGVGVVLVSDNQNIPWFRRDSHPTVTRIVRFIEDENYDD